MREQERLRMQYAASGIADAFVAARRGGTAISTYPGELPETLADAYASQALAIDRWSDAIGEWKVARINDPWRDLLQTNRYIGPIFTRTIVDAGFVSKVPVYEGGSGAFEAEITLVVGSDTDPERLSWSLEDAKSLIADVRLVIEAASSPSRRSLHLAPSPRLPLSATTAD
jgi:2-keto-4-pentenoate hydratase